MFCSFFKSYYTTNLKFSSFYYIQFSVKSRRAASYKNHETLIRCPESTARCSAHLQTQPWCRESRRHVPRARCPPGRRSASCPMGWRRPAWPLAGPPEVSSPHGSWKRWRLPLTTAAASLLQEKQETVSKAEFRLWQNLILEHGIIFKKCFLRCRENLLLIYQQILDLCHSFRHRLIFKNKIRNHRNTVSI